MSSSPRADGLILVLDVCCHVRRTWCNLCSMPASMTARPVVGGNRREPVHRLYIDPIRSCFSCSGRAVQTTLTSAHLEAGCAAQYSLWTLLAKLLKMSNCRLLRPSFSCTWVGESRSLMGGEFISSRAAKPNQQNVGMTMSATVSYTGLEPWEAHDAFAARSRLTRCVFSIASPLEWNLPSQVGLLAYPLHPHSYLSCTIHPLRRGELSLRNQRFQLGFWPPPHAKKPGRP